MTTLLSPVQPLHLNTISSIGSVGLASLSSQELKGEGTAHNTNNNLNFNHTSPSKLVYDLRLAIQTNQLIVTLQPKVCLETFYVTGYEVLLKWVHPHLGLIPADHWIRLAQDQNLMHSLTLWLLNQVVDLQKEAVAQEEAASIPALPYAINISPTCLTVDFAQHILSLIKHRRLPSSLIEVEITESTEFTDLPTLKKAINLLRQGGIKVGLDDFGNGYASLQTLVELEVDEIKIDKSIVQSTAKSTKMILTSLINLAKEMGMSVVLEGIETQQHLNLAKELGAHKAQGYLFSKPQPVSQKVCQDPTLCFRNTNNLTDITHMAS